VTEFTWIASYPKSGNTWCRYIVAHILFDFDPDTWRLDATIPDINNWTGDLIHQYKGAFPAKTHMTYSAIPPQMAMRNAIYLVRHPLDLVVSMAGYMEPEGSEDAVNDVLEDFIRGGGGLSKWLHLGFGTVSENVGSWADARDRGEPILIVRYEDLLQDPLAKTLEMAAFLDAPIDETRGREIVEATSFSSMQALEERQVRDRKADMFLVESEFKKGRDFKFMRSGTSGQFRDALSPKVIERLLPLCQPVLDRFSYAV